MKKVSVRFTWTVLINIYFIDVNIRFRIVIEDSVSPQFVVGLVF